MTDEERFLLLALVVSLVVVLLALAVQACTPVEGAQVTRIVEREPDVPEQLQTYADSLNGNVCYYFPGHLDSLFCLHMEE